MTSCCNSDFVLYLLHILDNDFFLCIILLVSIQPSCQQSHLNYLTFFFTCLWNFSNSLWFTCFDAFMYIYIIIHFVCNIWCGYLAIHFTRHCHKINVFLDFWTCLLNWQTSTSFSIWKRFSSTAILYALLIIQYFYPVAYFNPHSLLQPLISSLEPWQILLKFCVYYMHWISLISYSCSIFKELQRAR